MAVKMPVSRFLALVLIVFSTISYSFAALKGVNLKDGDLFEIQFAGKTYSCGLIGGNWIPGRMVKRLFIPAKTELKELQLTLKRTRDTKARKKLQKKIASLKAYKADGGTACLTGPGGGDGGGNYDALGNLTAAGKAAFGVPQYLSASANRGISTWNGTCFGCHQTSPSVLGPSTFPEIRARIQQSPMFFRIPEEVTDQQIADIVAYKNL